MKHISIKTLLDFFYLKIGYNWAFWIFLQLSRTATPDSKTPAWILFVSIHVYLGDFSQVLLSWQAKRKPKESCHSNRSISSLNLGATKAWTPGSEGRPAIVWPMHWSSTAIKAKTAFKNLLTMQFLDSRTKHHDLQSWDLPSPHLHAEQVPDGMRSAISGHLTCYVFALRLNYSEGLAKDIP